MSFGGGGGGATTKVIQKTTNKTRVFMVETESFKCLCAENFEAFYTKSLHVSVCAIGKIKLSF
jgi:hypothetical protein